MSRPRGPGLFFQSQNMDIHHDGFAVKKVNDSVSKNSQKKVGGNRKALQDLSNSGMGFQTQKLDNHKEGQKKPLQSLSKPGLVFQTQNLDIHKEGSSVKKLSDGIAKTSQKKAGANRKALQDLSNSLKIRQEAGAKKESLSRIHHNVAEESLHCTKHCAVARKAEKDQSVYDEILLEHGLIPPDTSLLSVEAEVASCGSAQRYLELEPIPEMPISATTDWRSSPTPLDSPAPSSLLYDLPNLKMSMLKERDSEQNQNSDIHHKGLTVKKTSDGMSKASQKKVGEAVIGNRKKVGMSKASQKKVGEAVIGNRKALQEDITNLSSLCQNASAKNLIGEVHNVAKEGFQHDHNKCIASQKAQIDHDRYNALLFEHGLPNLEASPEKNETVVDFSSHSMYPELEVPELPMPELTDLCCSPVALDSPPYSLSQYEVPELKLKACIVD